AKWMLRSFCASSFPKAAPCRSALFPLPPASKPLMSPGSHRDEQKISLILPCSSALPTFASRSFPLLILSPRSSRNALSISTPVPRKSGSVTSTDRCPFLSLLIINKLPLLCFARRSLTGFPDHLARSPDIFCPTCRPHPLPVRTSRADIPNRRESSWSAVTETFFVPLICGICGFKIGRRLQIHNG